MLFQKSVCGMVVNNKISIVQMIIIKKYGLFKMALLYLIFSIIKTIPGIKNGIRTAVSIPNPIVIWFKSRDNPGFNTIKVAAMMKATCHLTFDFLNNAIR